HAGESAVADADAVADAERCLAGDHLAPVLLARAGPQHLVDLVLRHGRWRAVNGTADEVADAGGLAEQVEDTVVVLHLAHEVARIELVFADDALGRAVAGLAHLRHAFDGNDDLAEVLFQALDLHPPLDRFLDRLLPATLDFNDIPTFVGRDRVRLGSAR